MLTDVGKVGLAVVAAVLETDSNSTAGNAAAPVAAMAVVVVEGVAAAAAEPFQQLTCAAHAYLVEWKASLQQPHWGRD